MRAPPAYGEPAPSEARFAAVDNAARECLVCCALSNEGPLHRKRWSRAPPAPPLWTTPHVNAGIVRLYWMKVAFIRNNGGG
jgi:hypothetical protein